MSERTIPPQCPSCGETLLVVKLECPACRTEVGGDFEPCRVCSLTGQARRVFDLFMESRGNLKGVQRGVAVSYPTARQRVDEMFQKLGYVRLPEKPQEILERVRSGEISVAEAERLLRRRG